MLPPLTWMVGPTMNLINKTQHLCEKSEHAFMVFRKYTIIFPIWHMTQHKTTKYARTSIQLSPLFKDTSLTSFPPHGVCLCFSLSLLVWLYFFLFVLVLFLFPWEKEYSVFLKKTVITRKKKRKKGKWKEEYLRPIHQLSEIALL